MGSVLKHPTRDREEWLQASESVCAVLELKQVPDHLTLNRAYHRFIQADWQRLLDILLAAIDAAEPEGLQEAYVAADSTCFAATQSSHDYISRSGRTMRTPFKGAYVVGTRSQLILAVRTGMGAGKDVHDLAVLRRYAKRYGVRPAGRRTQVLLADRAMLASR